MHEKQALYPSPHHQFPIQFHADFIDTAEFVSAFFNTDWHLMVEARLATYEKQKGEALAHLSSF